MRAGATHHRTAGCGPALPIIALPDAGLKVRSTRAAAVL